jgi:hypothetical protein
VSASGIENASTNDGGMGKWRRRARARRERQERGRLAAWFFDDVVFNGFILVFDYDDVIVIMTKYC